MITLQALTDRFNKTREEFIRTLKDNGIEIDSLAKEKKGKVLYFEEAVIKQISKYFEETIEDKEEEKKEDSDSQQLIAANKKIEEQQRIIENLEKDLALAREKIEMQQELIAKYTDDAEYSKRTIASLAESVRMQTMKEATRLPEPEKKHLGFFPWVKQKLFGSNEE